jgi:hypothetical protein
MSAQDRCHCQSCTIRGFTGPVIVITIGVLFLLDQMHGGALNFSNTFPMILVVLGLIHLASSMVSREGHIEPAPIPPVPPPPIPPPVNPPPMPPSGQGR